MSSPENAVYLLKDFRLQANRKKDFIQVEAEDKHFRHLIDPEGGSENLRAIQRNIQEMVSKRLLVLMMSVAPNEEELTCHVYFLKSILDRFSSILSKPSLTIILRLEDSTRAAEETILEKRFDLMNILADFRQAAEEHKKSWRPYKLFSAKGVSFKKVLCDVMLGWVETDKPKMKRIKLGAASVMENLYKRDDSKDLKLVAGNGAEVKCHRMIFEAHGDVLAAMISPTNAMMETTSGKIEMRENSEEGLTHLVRYLYGMELTNDDLTSFEVALELFKTAHQYLLKELQKRLGELFLQKGMDWWTPGGLIELYFHVKNLDEWKSLQDHALEIMLSMSKEISSCDRLDELSREDALGLVWKLVELGKQNSNLPTAKRKRLDA